MNGLSLFSGIGGIDRALEGYVDPILYCENDRYAQAVLLSRMSVGDLPVAPICDDVRTLKAKDIGSPVEIVYGGFPCQDISVAGRGAGLGGERSGLFFEIARLVGEIRPAFVFLENVPAINRRGGDVVVGTLADLGYDSRWDVLSAADVGANHRRERWWLLAYARGHKHEGKGHEIKRPAASRFSESMADAESRTRQWPPSRKTRHASFSGEDVADTDRLCGTATRRAWSGWTEFGNGGWWESEPDLGRVAHGVPNRVDRLRGLGNAVVSLQAREAFERLMGFK